LKDKLKKDNEKDKDCERRIQSITIEVVKIEG
jgi:hypothetical protein